MKEQNSRAGHRYLGQRDGRETNLDTGTSSNVILGERFPVRDFPPSRSRELGLFWQDEIGFGEAFALIPGLRWERYQLQAEADAMFREDYPLQEVVDVAHSAWTPKLGARWHASDRSTWFAQYARGFRAPPFGDVNIGLSLALLNYEVRPNPELQPETSAGLEAGWRWQDERLQPEGAASSISRALVPNIVLTWRHVDNPLDPRDGTVLQGQIGGGSKAALSTQSFIRVLGRFQQYFPLGSLDTLALRGDIGYTLADSRDGIPQEYVFRTGGTGTVRGYKYLSLGVADGSATVGGRYMATASAEVTHWLDPERVCWMTSRMSWPRSTSRL